MISNIYINAETGEPVVVVGLTEADVATITVKNMVLRLAPEDADQRAEGQADIILFSAKDDDALTAEMVKMFGQAGDDIPEKEKGT